MDQTSQMMKEAIAEHDDQKVTIHVFVGDADLKRRVRVAAAEAGVSMSAFIVRVLRDYLNDREE